MTKFDIAAIGELNVDVILNGIESEPEIGNVKFSHNNRLYGFYSWANIIQKSKPFEGFKKNLFKEICSVCAKLR